MREKNPKIQKAKKDKKIMSKKKSKTQTSIRRFLEQVSLRLRRERQLIKQQKLLPASSKLLQTTLTKLLNKELIR